MRNLLLALALSTLFTSSLFANRKVQFKSIDFTTGILEVQNFDTVAQSLTGWFLSSSAANDLTNFTASSGLSGVTLLPNQSLFIYLNNNAPADNSPLTRNRSQLGGAFAMPIDQGPYLLQLFLNTAINNPNSIVDHVQWNIDGATNSNFDDLSLRAVGAGLWNSRNAWISTTSQTQAITLTDLSGEDRSNPGDYEVTEPVTVAFPEFLEVLSCEATSAGEFTLSWEDLSAFGTVDYTVETTTDLSDPESWTATTDLPLQTTSTTIAGLSTGPQFFRVVAAPAS